MCFIESKLLVFKVSLINNVTIKNKKNVNGNRKSERWLRSREIVRKVPDLSQEVMFRECDNLRIIDQSKKYSGTSNELFQTFQNVVHHIMNLEIV